jgi:membrane protease YdiL (CAAX protease family)
VREKRDLFSVAASRLGGSRSAAPPPLWPVLVAYACAFVLTIAASMAYVLVASAARGVGAERFALSTPGLLGAALVTAVVLVSVTLVAARWAMGRPVAVRLRLGRTRARPLGFAAAIVGTAGLNLGCGAAAELLGLGQGGVMEAVAHALEAPSPSRIAAGLAAIAIAPAIAEEGFFRGFVQTYLEAKWGRWPAVLMAAAAFGLFHIDPVQGTIAFVAGVFLGWTVERMGGLRPSIAAHAANNAMFVLLAAYESPDERVAPTRAAIVLGAGAIACGVSIAVMRSPLGTRGEGEPPRR